MRFDKLDLMNCDAICDCEMRDARCKSNQHSASNQFNADLSIWWHTQTLQLGHTRAFPKTTNRDYSIMIENTHTQGTPKYLISIGTETRCCQNAPNSVGMNEASWPTSGSQATKTILHPFEMSWRMANKTGKSFLVDSSKWLSAFGLISGGGCSSIIIRVS